VLGHPISEVGGCILQLAGEGCYLSFQTGYALAVTKYALESVQAGNELANMGMNLRETFENGEGESKKDKDPVSGLVFGTALLLCGLGYSICHPKKDTESDLGKVFSNMVEMLVGEASIMQYKMYFRKDQAEGDA